MRHFARQVWVRVPGYDPVEEAATRFHGERALPARLGSLLLQRGTAAPENGRLAVTFTYPPF